MKLLIDTNIILDVLLKREQFCTPAIEVLNLSDRDDVEEYVSASAFTDIYYIAYRTIKDKEKVKTLLKNLLAVVRIAAVSEQEIKYALNTEWTDFEDSVQHAVAINERMDGIVTKNATDYKNAKISVWSPEQVLKVVKEM